MDIFDKAAALRQGGQAFALATVVARRAPVSAHLGDRAIVFADGRIEGFVGGACSHEIIRQQALEALRVRQPRLVSIRPDASAGGPESAELVTVPMTCASEGAVDVYVEPFVQPRRLVIIGATPVASSLAALARCMEYEVIRVVEPREQPELEREAAVQRTSLVALDGLEKALEEGASRGLEQAAVVASQGHYDEEALASILKRDVAYVGLVASRKRAATISGLLKDSGVPGVERIRNPAGLDLGARTPPEVAVSILAEIVQTHPAGGAVPLGAGAPQAAPAAPAGRAVDPVCGMSVDMSRARHTADLDGATYYFCCAACRTRFLENPQQFLGGH